MESYMNIAIMLIIGLFMWLIKIDIAGVKKDMKSLVNDDKCNERRESVCRKIKEVDDETQEQWGIINCHGHKGLDGDNNLVVRTAT